MFRSLLICMRCNGKLHITITWLNLAWKFLGQNYYDRISSFGDWGGPIRNKEVKNPGTAVPILARHVSKERCLVRLLMDNTKTLKKYSWIHIQIKLTGLCDMIFLKTIVGIRYINWSWSTVRLLQNVLGTHYDGDVESTKVRSQTNSVNFCFVLFWKFRISVNSEDTKKYYLLQFI